MPKISSRKTTIKAARPPERASAIQTTIPKRVSRDGRQASVDAIATRIRSARRRDQITLDVLASRVGLDKGYLSRIERGKKVPSAATLLNLAAALNIHVAHLFGDQTPRDAITVIRQQDHVKIPSDTDRPGYETILGANADNRMSVFLIRPLAEAPVERAGHSGDEVIYVVSGVIEILFIDRSITLNAGDVIHFSGDLKHQIHKLGAATAVALVIVANDLADTRRMSRRKYEKR
jgi:transcriptional regulator with XRE-family HTH domain